MAQANSALLQLMYAISPFYSIWVDESEQYGKMPYASRDDAQSVCDALQDTYDRFLWGCQFSVRFCNVAPRPAVNERLIGAEYR